MKSRRLKRLLQCGLLVGLVATTHAVPELERVEKEFAAAVEQHVEGALKKRSAALKKHLDQLVERESEKAQKEGSLDRVVGLRKLKQAWDAGLEAEVADDAVVKKVAAHARTQREKVAAERDDLFAPMARKYRQRLQALERWLVRKKRVDDGLVVREALNAFEAENAAVLARSGGKDSARSTGAPRAVGALKPPPAGYAVVWHVGGEAPNPPPAILQVPPHVGKVVRVRAPVSFQKIFFVLAVREDGSVTGWGDDRISWIKNLPSKEALSDAVDAAVVQRWGMALRANGQCYPLGGVSDALEARIFSLRNIRQLAAGRDHMMALDADGHVHNVGRGDPVPDAYQGRITKVCASDLDAMCLLDDGTVGHWGRESGKRIKWTEGIDKVIDISFRPMLMRVEGKTRLLGIHEGDPDWVGGVSNFAHFGSDSFRGIPAAVSQQGRWEMIDEKKGWTGYRNFEKQAKGCTQLIRIEEYFVGIRPDR